MCQKKFSGRDEGVRDSLRRVLSTRLGLMGRLGYHGTLCSPVPHEISPWHPTGGRDPPGHSVGAGGGAGEAVLVGQVTLGTAESTRA